VRSNLEDNSARDLRVHGAKYSTTTLTISAVYRLTEESTIYQFINGGASSRTIFLPEIDPLGGQQFWIVNIGLTNSLNVVDANGSAVGDVTANSSGVFFSSRSAWAFFTSALGIGSGDVVGPASAVNNNLVAFDGGTGKLIKDSGIAAGSFGTFLALTDTPDSYVGHALKVVRVNAGETGLEFVTGGGGGNAFGTIAVSGQSDVVADAASDILTLVAGTNITITTNVGTDTITINASGVGGYTNEEAQDAVGTILVDSTTIDFTYDDGTPSITAALIPGGITSLANLVTVQGRTVTLADAGADAVLGWDDSASAYQNLSAADVRAALGLATTDSPQFTALNVGAATDTTIARVSAGVISVEGVTILTTATGQPLDADLTSWAAITRAAGFDTFVVTPSSANLAALVTGETGTGALVFATSPGFTTAANPVSNDGAALGTTALGWSDLHLATGGVINWASGEVTITETDANTLTVAGASSVSIGTANAFVTGTIELGAATDTTLARVSAGVVSIEGVTVLTTATGQPLDADLTSWAAITRAAGFDTFVATPSSANLAALVTGETGSGALVFGTSPTFTTDITAPLISGGAAAGSTLTLQSTSGAGTTDLIAFRTASQVERLRINNAGVLNVPDPGILILGHTGGTGSFTASRLQINGIDVSGASQQSIAWSNDATGFLHIIGKSRGGVVGTQTIVQDGDDVGYISFRGSGGTFFRTAAEIQVSIDGTPGASDMPGRLVFSTTPDGSTSPVERLRIDSAGKLNIAGATSNFALNATNVLSANTPRVQIWNDDDTATVPFHFASSGTAPPIVFSRTGGATPSTHGVIGSGGLSVGRLLFLGSDGTDFGEMAMIRCATSEATASGSTPGDLWFYTTPSGSKVALARLLISQDGSSHFLTEDAATNTVTRVMNISHTTTGTAAAGFGSGISYVSENAAGSTEIIGATEVLYTDPTDGSEDADFRVLLSAAGAAVAEKFRVVSDGTININSIKHTASDAGFDALYGWDDSAGTYKSLLLADIGTEGAPAAGDFLYLIGAEGDLRKVNWSSLPGAGGGISNVVEDTTPQLGGDLDANTFAINGITEFNNLGVSFADEALDVLWGWDDSTSTYKNMTNAVIATEGAPAAGDFLLLMGAEGDLRKVNWSSLPAGGSPGGADGDIQYRIDGSTFGGSPLKRVDANTLEQRNSTTAQSHFIYNTFTDTSNYERIELSWVSNLFEIEAVALGTGTQRNIRLKAGGGNLDISSFNATCNLQLNMNTNPIDLGNSDTLILRSAAGLMRLEGIDAATNGVTPLLRLRHSTTGTAAAGIGLSLQFEQDTGSDNYEIGATIEAVTTDVTSTSEDFDLVFKTMVAGAAAAERARIGGADGSLTLNSASNGTTITITGSDRSGVLGLNGAGNGLAVLSRFDIQNAGGTSVIRFVEGNISGGGLVFEQIAQGNLRLEGTTAATNAVEPLLRLRHTTSGTPASGIGLSIGFEQETASGNYEVGATITAITTDVGSGTEDFDITISTMAAGAAAAERLRIGSLGVNPSVRIIENEVILTDGANVTLDSSLGNTFKLVAAGSRTIDAPTNKPASGKVEKIVIMHEASGADRTLTLTTGSAGAFRFGTDITALTATTNNDADDRWDVVSYTKGF